MSVERCVVRGRSSGVDRERSRGDFVGEFEVFRERWAGDDRERCRVVVKRLGASVRLELRFGLLVDSKLVKSG